MSPVAISTEALPDELSREISSKDRRVWQAERLRLLWERRRLLVRVTVLGLLGSALLAFLIPRSYTSTAQLMPPDSQSNSSLAMVASLAAKTAGGFGALAGDVLGLKTPGALFIGIVRSDAAEARLVEQFDLKKVYGDRLEQDARADLDAHTVVSEDRKSGIISISVIDRSPQRAAALTQAYVDQLNSLIVELSVSSAHRERIFLEERLRVAKHELDEASNELAQFSSQNSTLDFQTMGKAALDAAGRLAGELIVAQSQLEGLRRIYSDNNPRVQALEGRVAELRRQLKQLDGSKAGSALPDSTVATGSTAAPLQGLSADMPYPSLRNLPLLGVKYADYYRRAKIQESVYELLTEQYELTKIQEVKETPTVKVLDRPKVAQKKSSPQRPQIMILGTSLACGVCLAWILAPATWQAFDPKDPRKVLAIEIAAAFKARALRALPNGRNGTGGNHRIFRQAAAGDPPVNGKNAPAE